MWLLLLIWFVTFGFIGGALARTRGYSTILGVLAGATGFGALLMLAYLPDRTQVSTSKKKSSDVDQAPQK